MPNKRNNLSRRFSKKKPRRRRRRNKRRSWGRKGRRWRRGTNLPTNVGSLPAGFSRQSTAYFYTRSVSNGLLVFGADLVTPLPAAVVYNPDESLFCVITCNPAYWEGTRCAQLAGAYQNYRPLKMKFRFVPQVPVTTPGSVIVGTVWNTPTAQAGLQQTLVTSNGGRLCQCYVPFQTTIKLGANLPQNLFQCAGNLDVDHNPFLFLAMMKGSPVVPGYFFVEYAFEFKNPVGMGVRYSAHRSQYPNTGLPSANKSLVTLAPIPGLSGAGLVLDIESNGMCYYNGSEVFPPEGTPLMVYSNQPIINPDSGPYATLSTFTWAPVKSGSGVVIPDLTGRPLHEAATISSNYAAYGQNGYAIYNVTDDSHTQTKRFSEGADFKWSFEKLADAADTVLSMWGEDLPDGTPLETYAYDPSMQRVGSRISTVTSGPTTRVKPAQIIRLARGLYNAFNPELSTYSQVFRGEKKESDTADETTKEDNKSARRPKKVVRTMVELNSDSD